MALRTRLSLFCWLFVMVAQGFIYPVMQCNNENAQPDECSTEVEGAIDSVLPWFQPYILHEDKNDRRLLECNRFCEERTYFSFHAPCDCTNRRLVAVDRDLGRKLATTEVNPLEGPLQLLEKYVQTLQDERCRQVLIQSKCFVNFVSEYDKTIEFKPKPGMSGGILSIPGLDLIEAEEYDPLTHQASFIDITTGEMKPSDIDIDYDATTPTTEHDIGDLMIIDEEKYDPATGEPIVVNPNDPYDPRGEDPTDVSQPDNDSSIDDNLGSGMGGAPPDDDPADVDRPVDFP